MSCKNKLVDLLDELLKHFDDGNKLILKKVIVLRHKLRNVVSEQLVQDYFDNFVAEHFDEIVDRQVSIIKHLPNECSDCESIWTELSPANRNLVWDWIDSIANIQKYQQ